MRCVNLGVPPPPGFRHGRLQGRHHRRCAYRPLRPLRTPTTHGHPRRFEIYSELCQRTGSDTLPTGTQPGQPSKLARRGTSLSHSKPLLRWVTAVFDLSVFVLLYRIGVHLWDAFTILF